jgi:mannosyltransferase OCH1-like enzyme
MNIIQTWKTKDIPDHYKQFVEKLKELNPTHNYMFFDDDTIVEFMKSVMSKYYDTFSKLTNKIEQIDFFRYVAVYYYGGLYIDLDVDMVNKIDDFTELGEKCVFPIEIKNVCDVFLKNQDVNYLVGNYAFYGTKGHPFLKRIIDNIVKQRIDDKDIRIAQETCTDDTRDVYVYYRTGPILVTQTYIDYLKETPSNDVFIIEPQPYQDNCFGNYGFHRCYGSWRHGHPQQKQQDTL